MCCFWQIKIDSDSDRPLIPRNSSLFQRIEPPTPYLMGRVADALTTQPASNKFINNEQSLIDVMIVIPGLTESAVLSTISISPETVIEAQPSTRV